MRARSVNILVAIIISAVSICLLWQIKGIPREGAIFPSFLLYSLLACAVFLVLQPILPKFKNELIVVFGDIPCVLWCVVVGIFIFYMVGLFYFGFYTTTFISSMGVVTAMSINTWKKAILSNLLFSLGLTGSLYLFFSLLLHVPFPEGILF